MGIEMSVVLKEKREKERTDRKTELTWALYAHSHIKNIRLDLLRLSFSVLAPPINYSQANYESPQKQIAPSRFCLLVLLHLFTGSLFSLAHGLSPWRWEEEKAPRFLSPAIIPRKWISRCDAAREIRSSDQPSPQIRYVRF